MVKGPACPVPAVCALVLEEPGGLACCRTLGRACTLPSGFQSLKWGGGHGKCPALSPSHLMSRMGTIIVSLYRAVMGMKFPDTGKEGCTRLCLLQRILSKATVVNMTT